MTKPEIKTIQTMDELAPTDFESRYNPELTEHIDEISGDYDQGTINTIALWKVNRYPYLDKETINKLNSIAKDERLEEDHKEILCLLLSCKGVQLPMASTFLRFRNPLIFQIIDQRVYRLLTGHELKLPIGDTKSAREKTCALYFNYLELLRKKCIQLQIPFEQADRILYNADKRLNKGNKLRNYGG